MNETDRNRLDIKLRKDVDQLSRAERGIAVVAYTLVKPVRRSAACTAASAVDTDRRGTMLTLKSRLVAESRNRHVSGIQPYRREDFHGDLIRATSGQTDNGALARARR
ncbi:MAG TPA: hypothetical protein VF573_14570 [Paraburkholderia sp.]|uniref:hypothetical protein n=1 Tax=Paraburkholderia sp. TaxID=1926495 RepID=UPI002ECFDBD3